MSQMTLKKLQGFSRNEHQQSKFGCLHGHSIWGDWHCHGVLAGDYVVSFEIFGNSGNFCTGNHSLVTPTICMV